jgi:hypothetical protein
VQRLGASPGSLGRLLSRQDAARQGNGDIAAVQVCRLDQPKSQLGLLVIDSVTLSKCLVELDREQVQPKLMLRFLWAYRRHTG